MANDPHLADQVRLAHVCGVLLAHPTTPVYAFSDTMPTTKMGQQGQIKLPFRFFGLFDGAEVEHVDISFSNRTGAALANKTAAFAAYMLEEHEQDEDDGTTSRVIVASLNPRIYGRTSFRTFFTSIKQLTAYSSTAAKTFERPCEVAFSEEEEVMFAKHARLFEQFYGIPVTAQLLHEVTAVLKERMGDGLCMSEMFWDEDDFVYAYKIMLGFAEKWDLTTLPLPDVFMEALVRDRIDREKTVAFLRLTARDTVLKAMM